MAILPLALSTVAAGAGAWFYLRRPRAATAAAGAALALLLLKVAVGYVPAAEPSFFPWSWYPRVEAWWYFVPGMFLLGAGAVAVRGSIWKRDLVLVVLGLLSLRESVIAWESGINHARLRGAVDGRGVCLQTSTYSCGAAASAMFLHRHGIPATEREMAILCSTRPFGGTTESGLAWGLRRKMAGRPIRVAAPRYEDLPRPSLVSLRLAPFLGHCVLVEDVFPDRVLLVDPMVGPRKVPRAIFERAWQGSAVFAE